MNPETEFKNGLWMQFKHSSSRSIGRAVALFWPRWLWPSPCPPARKRRPPPSPFSDIGARATADYQGDALGVTATPDGARLRCGFQKLEGHATPEGLWLESTEPGARESSASSPPDRQVLPCGSPQPLRQGGSCSGLPQSRRCRVEPRLCERRSFPPPAPFRWRTSWSGSRVPA